MKIKNMFKYFIFIYTSIPLISIQTFRYNRYDMSYSKLPPLLPESQMKTQPEHSLYPPIPLWKQKACQKAQLTKATSHYICNQYGEVKCLPGWQGDLCQVPICRKGCDPMNGFCQRPGECRCNLGYMGELCDKCMLLPGCQHGDCNKPFECLCKTGWKGLFCTEPSCRKGCNKTRGYCELPGECRCRLGWAGRNCTDCAVMPGCQFGTCNKPLECNCHPGYTGLLCTTPICAANCNRQHGYCTKPGECRCKVGWTGINCDKCFPYPGCVNGDCEKPWECNCQIGWGGMLCNEPLTFCVDNPNICKNNGLCISLTKDEGNYRCQCEKGYTGVNCEILDEFMLTSTMIPRITPPPPPLPESSFATTKITQLSIMLTPSESGQTSALTVTSTKAPITTPMIVLNNSLHFNDNKADNNDNENVDGDAKYDNNYTQLNIEMFNKTKKVSNNTINLLQHQTYNNTLLEPFINNSTEIEAITITLPTTAITERSQQDDLRNITLTTSKPESPSTKFNNITTTMVSSKKIATTTKTVENLYGNRNKTKTLTDHKHMKGIITTATTIMPILSFNKLFANNLKCDEIQLKNCTESIDDQQANNINNYENHDTVQDDDDDDDDEVEENDDDDDDEDEYEEYDDDNEDDGD